MGDGITAGATATLTPLCKSKNPVVLHATNFKQNMPLCLEQQRSAFIDCLRPHAFEFCFIDLNFVATPCGQAILWKLLLALSDSRSDALQSCL